MNNAHNDFIQGAAKYNNPKLIINMTGTQQLFDLTEGLNKPQFVVQTRTSGYIKYSISDGLCERSPIKPKIRFKKVNIKQI